MYSSAVEDSSLVNLKARQGETVCAQLNTNKSRCPTSASAGALK